MTAQGGVVLTIYKQTQHRPHPYHYFLFNYLITQLNIIVIVIFNIKIKAIIKTVKVTVTGPREVIHLEAMTNNFQIVFFQNVFIEHHHPHHTVAKSVKISTNQFSDP